MNRETDAPSTDPVHIGEGEIRWLKKTFANQWHREPTGEELHRLVSSLLEEELLAREAKTLGLDQNDTVVRRRLAQKLTFLVDDTSRISEPSDEDLRQFYDTNAERFRVEPRVSFTQIFFNPARRQHAETDAKAALVLISTSDGNDTRSNNGRSNFARYRVSRRRRPDDLELVRSRISRGAYSCSSPGHGLARLGPVTACISCR